MVTEKCKFISLTTLFILIFYTCFTKCILDKNLQNTYLTQRSQKTDFCHKGCCVADKPLLTV
jgi:hypothetical protein